MIVNCCDALTHLQCSWLLHCTHIQLQAICILHNNDDHILHDLLHEEVCGRTTQLASKQSKTTPLAWYTLYMLLSMLSRQDIDRLYRNLLHVISELSHCKSYIVLHSWITPTLSYKPFAYFKMSKRTCFMKRGPAVLLNHHQNKAEPIH